MSSVVDFAIAILSQAEKRVEIAGQNMANATTPAYKRKIPFSDLVQMDNNGNVSTSNVASVIDFTNGKLSQTGSPSDLAIASNGYFALRSKNGIVYSRQGQFAVNQEGNLVNSQGFPLQTTSGSDLVIKSRDFVVTIDGTVTEKSLVVGKIAVFDASDEKNLEPTDGGFRAKSKELPLVDEAMIRQGMFENSNVTTGDEMVAMMESLRRAESGQRLMNVYDDLMGRAISGFGDNLR
jgi:flagellar basal-body rod protein FlgF